MTAFAGPMPRRDDVGRYDQSGVCVGWVIDFLMDIIILLMNIMHHFIYSVSLVVLLGVAVHGCADQTDYARLHMYNDRWALSVALDEGGEGYTGVVTIYATRRDQTEANETSESLAVYHELSLASGLLATGTGEVSHNEITNISNDSYYPLANHEFIQLTLARKVQSQGLGGKVLCDTTPATYEAALSEFGANLGAQDPCGDRPPDIELAAERTGDLLTGIIYAVEWFPLTACDDNSGAQGVRRRLGSVTMQRLDAQLPGEIVSDSVIEGACFRFETTMEFSTTIRSITWKTM